MPEQRQGRRVGGSPGRVRRRSSRDQCVELAAGALTQLAKVAEILHRRHPDAPEDDPLKALHLPLTLELSGTTQDVADQARELVARLRRELDEAFVASQAYRAGHAYCLRCESSACSHAEPPEPRAVFAGYGQTGRPAWRDLSEWLSARRDPRIHRLFEDSPQLVALHSSPEELHAELLPGFETARRRCQLLGQLVVGWFRDHLAATDPATALTVQVVRHETGTGRGALSVNLLGRLPDRHHPEDGELEESLFLGLPEALRPVRRELAAMTRGQRRVPAKGEGLRRMQQRVMVLLREACRDLEHRIRADGRRTIHARERAQDRTRPTAKAFEDARGANPDALLEDREKRTIVVLGPRSRVHFFTPGGKHVTSVIYPGHVVKHRTLRRRWTPLEAHACRAFQQEIRSRSLP